MQPLRRLIVTLALLATSSPAMIGTAQAAPPDKEHFRDPFSFSEELCEVPVDVVGEAWGSFVGKPRGKGSTYYGAAQIHVFVSWSNPENGRTITQKSNYVDKDQKITDNGDETITMTGLAAGGETTFGPDGKLIFNNPGQVRYQILIGTNGTLNDPSDDYFISDLGVVFGSTGRNDEFDCLLVASLLTG